MGLPDALRTALADARSVGVVTGAGVSAESGIRTYRGVGGLYDDPEEGERTVEALTGATLARDPDRTWRAVAMLARQAVDARPNAAHEAIVSLENKAARFALLTQNVDGLHQAAGSRNVIDIHGSVFWTRCIDCGARGTLTPDDIRALDAAPRCAACGGVRRPDAVLFGEMLPADGLRRIDEEFLRDPPDVVISAGTSALFAYVAEPVVHAARRGRTTVEVNPEATMLTSVVDHALAGPAGVYLPLVADAFGGSAQA